MNAPVPYYSQQARLHTGWHEAVPPIGLGAAHLQVHVVQSREALLHVELVRCGASVRKCESGVWCGGTDNLAAGRWGCEARHDPAQVGGGFSLLSRKHLKTCVGGGRLVQRKRHTWSALSRTTKNRAFMLLYKAQW